MLSLNRGGRVSHRSGTPIVGGTHYWVDYWGVIWTAPVRACIYFLGFILFHFLLDNISKSKLILSTYRQMHFLLWRAPRNIFIYYIFRTVLLLDYLPVFTWYGTNYFRRVHCTRGRRAPGGGRSIPSPLESGGHWRETYQWLYCRGNGAGACKTHSYWCLSGAWLYFQGQGRAQQLHHMESHYVICLWLWLFQLVSRRHD